MNVVKVGRKYIPADAETITKFRKAGFATTELTSSLLTLVSDTINIEPTITQFADLEEEFLNTLFAKWQGKKRKCSKKDNQITFTCVVTDKGRDACEKVATHLREFYRRWGIVVTATLTQSPTTYKLVVSIKDKTQTPVLPTTGDLVESQELVLGFTKLVLRKVTSPQGQVRVDIEVCRKAGPDWAPPVFISSCLEAEVGSTKKLLKLLESL